MDVKDLMLEKGVKPSVTRLAIYDYLYNHRTHPTVDEIYEALSPEIPTLSKTTVYNTVNLLANSGIIKSISIEGFRTRYDANNNFHAHFLCTKCNNVYDIFDLECPKCPLDGFTVSSEDIFYTGSCKACSDRK